MEVLFSCDYDYGKTSASSDIIFTINIIQKEKKTVMLCNEQLESLYKNYGAFLFRKGKVVLGVLRSDQIQLNRDQEMLTKARILDLKSISFIHRSFTPLSMESLGLRKNGRRDQGTC